MAMKATHTHAGFNTQEGLEVQNINFLSIRLQVLISKYVDKIWSQIVWGVYNLGAETQQN